MEKEILYKFVRNKIARARRRVDRIVIYTDAPNTVVVDEFCVPRRLYRKAHPRARLQEIIEEIKNKGFREL